MDNKTTIRLKKLSFEGIKNIENGELEIPQDSSKEEVKEGCILGIWGQNNSGKSAAIYVLKILKTIMSGLSIINDDLKLEKEISITKGTGKIEASFIVQSDENYGVADYHLIFSSKGGKVEINSEELGFKPIMKNEDRNHKVLVETNDSEPYSFNPKSQVRHFIKHYKGNGGRARMEAELGILSHLSKIEGISSIFGERGQAFFCRKEKEFEIYSFLILALNHFAKEELVVFDSHVDSSYRFTITNEEGKVLELPVNHSVLYHKEDFDFIKKKLEDMRTLLVTMIPSAFFNLKIINEGNYFSDGEEGIRAQLFTKKEMKELPFSNESQGTLKIFALTDLIYKVYKDPSFCLVIDDFEKGINEYLFGQIVMTLMKGAKGQLIFASNNFKPLEFLSYRNMKFTKYDGLENYTYLHGKSSDKNAKVYYLEEIDKGADQLFKLTSIITMAEALRRKE